ncbi:hypothetical protein JCGZ_25138 [Jatropha curcas]|uniref:Uncharacterized protein n=1 Tax=Jatropha curcas TaxID=180498 RepID=A0A067JZ95_JATCU|nr:hypothetical protein JCGZ_25138 [Jatropha curcas]
MGDISIPASKVEKMVKKIVAANLEKLLRSDKGKVHVVHVEDEEIKRELKRKNKLMKYGKVKNSLPRR